MRTLPLSDVEGDLPRFLREAEGEEIVITRDGKPAGVLIGFASEDDWFDYQLENDPRFLRRIKDARKSLRAGEGSGSRTSKQNPKADGVVAWFVSEYFLVRRSRPLRTALAPTLTLPRERGREMEARRVSCASGRLAACGRRLG